MVKVSEGGLLQRMDVARELIERAKEQEKKVEKIGATQLIFIKMEAYAEMTKHYFSLKKAFETLCVFLKKNPTLDHTFFQDIFYFGINGFSSVNFTSTLQDLQLIPIQGGPNDSYFFGSEEVKRAKCYMFIGSVKKAEVRVGDKIFTIAKLEPLNFNVSSNSGLSSMFTISTLKNFNHCYTLSVLNDQYYYNRIPFAPTIEFKDCVLVIGEMGSFARKDSYLYGKIYPKFILELPLVLPNEESVIPPEVDLEHFFKYPFSNGIK